VAAPSDRAGGGDCGGGGAAAPRAVSESTPRRSAAQCDACSGEVTAPTSSCQVAIGSAKNSSTEAGARKIPI